MSTLRVLLVAPELTPLAPVGGIAEYLLGLATSLLRKGHDVRVALPAYGYLRSREDLTQIGERLVISLGVGAAEISRAYETSIECPGGDRHRLQVYLLGEHKHLASVSSKELVYRWPNHAPWIVFSRSIIDFLESSDWRPDIIHCHDAHTALVPVYIRELRNKDRKHWAHETRTVLTIHNLLYQGTGDPSLVSFAGLPQGLFNTDCFEYYGQANCLKAGLVSADAVNTVSRTYAQEICTSEEFGFGLEGVLRHLRETGRLSGIVNGIDEDRWRLNGLDCDGDDRVEVVDEARKACRRKCFKQWNWPMTNEPVIGFRARWDMQKGIETLVQGMEQLLGVAKVVVVTWGTPGDSAELRDLWRQLQLLAEQSKDRLEINPKGLSKPEETAEHYTLADFFLMPSWYEPCGLVQMECQRYGAIPIVSQTGGLADTVAEDGPNPNGFLLERKSVAAMIDAVNRAIEAWPSPEERVQLIRNTLAQRNAWDTRVPEYEALYAPFA